jgi:hypothetical protein
MDYTIVYKLILLDDMTPKITSKTPIRPMKFNWIELILNLTRNVFLLEHPYPQ